MQKLQYAMIRWFLSFSLLSPGSAVCNLVSRARFSTGLTLLCVHLSPYHVRFFETFWSLNVVESVVCNIFGWWLYTCVHTHGLYYKIFMTCGKSYFGYHSRKVFLSTWKIQRAKWGFCKYINTLCIILTRQKFMKRNV